MKDITIVPDDFVITHKKTDIIMDCTKDGDITYAVERTYKRLVRCKDCKYWHDDGIMTTCDKNIGHGFPSDYFCADGERRK